MIPFLELLYMTSQIIYLYSIQFIPKKTDYEPRHTTYTRNFTKRSVDDFIRKISQENWITVYLQNNPENAYNNFLRIFYSYYNSCFSVKAKTTKSNRPRKDWCTVFSGL